MGSIGPYSEKTNEFKSTLADWWNSQCQQQMYTTTVEISLLRIQIRDGKIRIRDPNPQVPGFGSNFVSKKSHNLNLKFVNTEPLLNPDTDSVKCLMVKMFLKKLTFEWYPTVKPYEFLRSSRRSLLTFFIYFLFFGYHFLRHGTGFTDKLKPESVRIRNRNNWVWV